MFKQADCAGLTLPSADTGPVRCRIKIVHIINGLGVGGAELALTRLVTNADRRAFDMQVVTLLGVMPLGDELRAKGIGVHSVNMSKGTLNLSALGRLVRLLRRERPHLVQTWLQQSDLVGGVAARVAGVGPVLWNIRHSTLHPVFSKKTTRILTLACAKLSRILPEHIVCCSEASRREQVKLGYAAEKMLVIPNGVDTARFHPDRDARQSVRAELGIPREAPVFGAAGRFDPAKDHRSLVRAAAGIAARNPECHFVFCGEGVSTENPELAGWVNGTGLSDRFHLLGERRDIQRIMATFDVFLSSSCFSEGFPNVVSEAMACGSTAIVTDVGDSASIVGDTGTVVPAEDPAAMVSAARALLGTGMEFIRKRGLLARCRILENFSLSRMIARYQQLYAEAVAEHQR
jgi:glycosyltransferase involved in cell wall biosynthesis